MNRMAQEIWAARLSWASPLVPHFLLPFYSFSMSVAAEKRKCYKFGGTEEQLLLNLSFVASIATHFVTRFDGAVELLRQTFPVACYAWSTFCRAAVATLAVHRKAHAWVTHAPSFLDHSLHWGLGGRLGKTFNDF